jgi:uncharacterized membrane protein
MARRIGLIASHPSLSAGVAAAVLVLGALWITPNPMTGVEKALAAWDALTITFIAVLFWQKRHATAERMAAAGQEDEGRHTILALCLLAAGAGVTAIAMELASARGVPNAGAHFAFAFLTVALSWTFTHLVFASHYAHEYYAPDEDGHREGLLFPGGEKPDFADFLHFALVIGVANQTADVQISSRYIRRTVTLHGIVAFLFNTVILAMSINFAASLFG